MLPTLKIVILKNDINKAGEALLYLQYTYNRRVNRISLQKNIPAECWMGKRPKYVAKTKNFPFFLENEINYWLGQQLAQGERIVLNFSLMKKEFSFAAFKNEFSGPAKSKADNLYFWLQKYFEFRNKRGVSEGTGVVYASYERKLKQYKEKIRISEIDNDWLADFEYYLTEKLGNGINTRYKIMVTLRAVLNYALDRDAPVNKKAFKDYTLKKEVKEKRPLTVFEVRKLLQVFRSGLLIHRLHETLRNFLFACCTGMDYSTFMAFNPELDLQEFEKGVFFIQKTRGKTGVGFFIPLNQTALSLIPEDRIFHKISGQKTNVYIKEILSSFGINPYGISFHTARHTFSSLAANFFITREIREKMMGHSSGKMNDHYTKINAATIIKEMEKWGLEEE